MFFIFSHCIFPGPVCTFYKCQRELKLLQRMFFTFQMLYLVFKMWENFLKTKSLTLQALWEAVLSICSISLSRVTLHVKWIHLSQELHWTHPRCFSSYSEIRQRTDPHLPFLLQFLWTLLDNLAIIWSSYSFSTDYCSLMLSKSKNCSQNILYSPSHTKSSLLFAFHLSSFAGVPNSFDVQSWLFTRYNNIL